MLGKVQNQRMHNGFGLFMHTGAQRKLVSKSSGHPARRAEKKEASLFD